MKNHLANASYGILDYAAYPLGLLVVAPFALRTLGVAQYGVWMFANAALTAGSVIASGFGDANIRHVSLRRGMGDWPNLLLSVRSTMGIHTGLGALIASIAWLLAPVAVPHIAPSNPQLQFECLWSLRIVSLLIFVRALETVCVSTQRAFERYGVAVGYSVLARMLSLAAVLFPIARHSVVVLMLVTAVFLTASLILQFLQLAQLLHTVSLWPAFDRDTTRTLLGFGIFSWIQAVSGILYGQADRLLTGVSLGAAAVASYALCAQLAQPIYGIVASGLHFLFPYVSARSASHALPSLRRPVSLSFAANFVMVVVGAVALLLLGAPVLVRWGGPAIADAGKPILPLLIVAAAAQALAVTGSYTMLALGRVRIVTFLNLAGGAGLLLLAPWLLPRYGTEGVALARLCCAPFPLLVYIPLCLLLFRPARTPSHATSIAAVCEDL